MLNSRKVSGFLLDVTGVLYNTNDKGGVAIQGSIDAVNRLVYLFFINYFIVMIHYYLFYKDEIDINLFLSLSIKIITLLIISDFTMNQN